MDFYEIYILGCMIIMLRGIFRKCIQFDCVSCTGGVYCFDIGNSKKFRQLS
jgi:hypothetical protein